MIKDIATIRDVVESANIPENPRGIGNKVDDVEIYKLINRFYNERGDINPEKYVLDHDDGKIETRTTLGRPSDNNLPIDKVTPRQFHHSHFSSTGLAIAGIDQEGSWNGEKAGLVYDNGTIDLIKSDYYTTRSFGFLPYAETASVIHNSDSKLDEIDLDKLSLRNNYLRSKEDLHRTKWLASGGSVGGVIIANSGDDWRIIMGKRSDRTNINPGMISIVPNGALRYDNVSDDGFTKDLNLHFNEELFRGQKQPNFFEDFVEAYRVSTGWNLRSGEMSIGYGLIIRDEGGYNMLRETTSHNFEFDSMLDVSVHNVERLSEILKIGNVSPSVIPIIYRSLVLLENVVDDVELNYNINQKI